MVLNESRETEQRDAYCRYCVTNNALLRYLKDCYFVNLLFEYALDMGVNIIELREFINSKQVVVLRYILCGSHRRIIYFLFYTYIIECSDCCCRSHVPVDWPVYLCFINTGQLLE